MNLSPTISVWKMAGRKIPGKLRSHVAIIINRRGIFFFLQLHGEVSLCRGLFPTVSIAKQLPH